MNFERSSGILLHPTSLPGEYGVGDIGPQAYRWLDFLSECNCGYWQILPLGPTGYGDSPYQCFSAFAGNPLLISPECLLEDNLLHSDDIVDKPDFPKTRIDYPGVISWKSALLDRAYNHFKRARSKELIKSFDNYKQTQSQWLDDFALFMALKETQKGAPWHHWEIQIRKRNPDTLEEARKGFKKAVERYKFHQFIFHRQWAELRRQAASRNIKIIGDIPIFIAHDSADVWANPELFYLKENGNPEFVSGVPPDYFSSTGQLWGNPIYRWDAHQENGYDWWINRFRAILESVDVVRLDHFRGFAGYWEIPGDAKTAEIGRWAPGPGTQFFNAIKNELGDLPFIAEDLGVITDDVIKMREDLNLPGMKVLQFAFAGDSTDPFLPHNYPENCVAYTGTHDNDTAKGWYDRVPESERDFYRRYLKRSGENVAWDLIHACWASVAVLSVAPFQDFLNLGNDARMNYPGKPEGNWSWRMMSNDLNPQLIDRIKETNYLYSRENK